MKRPIKVLIIEDDSNIVELIQLYMDKIGFSSISASDGEEGLDLFLVSRLIVSFSISCYLK
ncbi:hypothetical protein [Ornithinibacillus hominis]|uniref:hypothetical protein n=1 Tax=Ornithinibacillus hominis TaxID=2763055 RepID=UPI0021044DCD